MKKLFTLLLISACLTACTKKKDATDNNTGADIKNGTWRISYYWDQKDETGNFSGQILMFLDGGTLMAHKGSAVVTGTWSQTSTKLIISFTDPVLSDLSNDWLITEKTSTSFKLKEDNPAQDDQLHLVKN